MVAQAYNPSTQEADSGGPEFNASLGYTVLLSETTKAGKNSHRKQQQQFHIIKSNTGFKDYSFLNPIVICFFSVNKSPNNYPT